MNIGTETIVKKLEEKVQEIKFALANQEQKKLKEELISIKAYCDLLLEATPEEQISVSTPVIKNPSIENSKQPEQKQKVQLEKPSSDSLFDF
ncbi:hypothetical protein BKP37_15280 [Anaerobacillus alkalilacustris]|uniref:YwdI family protein n=1 Tax=Anaerobacillus alkalilacustris TaxID=393763 RepID=A0A1S2LH06_9BACI|nr:DUF5327 family protein [Anaerobacillus alkalilacustris]OIJ11799.1 hypothetical protein BKP37_15280 [Anaerobacillus alkalilacustris]